MSENVRTALITATAVLFGGVIAGGASIVTTVVTQDSENERIERRADEEARGAARLLYNRFLAVISAMNTIQREGVYIAGIRYMPVPPPSAADLKQVHVRLSAEEFEEVTEALVVTQAFFFVVREEDGEVLDPADRAGLRQMNKSVAVGAAALFDLADLELPSGGGP